MFRMSSVGFASVSFLCHWVSIEVDLSIVICRHEDLFIVGPVNSVDVASISAWREDALNWPSELARERGPFFIFKCSCSGCLLLAIDIEKEVFVGSTVGLKIIRID